jgi:hypothetical protein
VPLASYNYANGDVPIHSVIAMTTRPSSIRYH